jgi:hypothetical protein
MILASSQAVQICAGSRLHNQESVHVTVSLQYEPSKSFDSYRNMSLHNFWVAIR